MSASSRASSCSGVSSETVCGAFFGIGRPDLTGLLRGTGCRGASGDLRSRATKWPSPRARWGQTRSMPSFDAPSPGREKSSGEKSGWRSRNAAMVHSSSARLNVQVEYTSRPPGRTIFAAESRISA